MAKELTTALPHLAPTGDIGKLIGSFQIDVYGFQDVALDRLPNAEERRLLQDRQREIMTLLRPLSYSMADKEKAAKALALMFHGYLSLRNANAIELVNGFLLHLDTVPLFALCRACDDIAHNRVADLDPDYPPTSPRLAKEAQRYITPLAIEREKIDQILTTKKLLSAPVNKASEEKIKKSLAELAAALKRTDDRDRDVLKAKVAKDQGDWHRKRILKEYDAMKLAPVYFGGTLIEPALLKMLKPLGPKQEHEDARRPQPAASDRRPTRVAQKLQPSRGVPS